MDTLFEFEEERPPATIVPRQYQIDAVDAVSNSWRSGFRAPLIVLPTGAGKTIVMGEMSRRAVERGKRVVIIAHRDELIMQAQNKIWSVAGIRPSVEKASFKAGADDKIIVGSVQTLAGDGRNIAGRPIDLLMIDEAHHCLDGNQYGKVIDKLAPKRIVGVTATPYRGDKKALGGEKGVFDDNPFTMSLLDMIALGERTGGKEGLCDIRVKALPVKIDLSGVHTSRGDFVGEEVSAALEPVLGELAGIIARQYRNAKLLAFWPLCETSRLWTEALRAHGIDARHVQGDSPDRKELLDGFARNEFRFLSNASLLTEGYDEPSIDTVLLGRPTKSRVLHAQMIGRGTRLFPGKPYLTVLDPMFNCERHEIMRTAHMAAEDDAQAELIQDAMDRGMTLSEAIADAAEQRRQKLAEKITTAGRRSGYEKKLADLSLNLGDVGLADWEPTMGWHGEPPTDKQLAALEAAGVDGALIHCKGQAKYVMDCLARRRENGLATIKQVRYARRLGHPEPERLTFVEATAWIDAARGGRRHAA